MRQVKGFKFRQQHIILGYIIDFYCPSAKLIIEVDGEIHESSRKQDEERDQVLQTTGYKVLRFKNEQIDKELDIVYLI